MAVIVVADDNVNDLALVAYIMRSQGHEVFAARNGLEAFQTIREHHPDAVLSDLVMPVVDGHALVNLVRNDPEVARVPMLAVTAAGGWGTHDEETAMAEGYDDFVAKPLTAEDLIARVAALL